MSETMQTILLSAGQVAQALGVSKRQVCRLTSSAKAVPELPAMYRPGESRSDALLTVKRVTPSARKYEERSIP
jgi:hypothetical protein